MQEQLSRATQEQLPSVQLGRSRTSLCYTAPEHPCSMYMSTPRAFPRIVCNNTQGTFEEVFAVPNINFILEGERSYLASRYSCGGLLLCNVFFNEIS
jgi:hypothetical protein